MTDLISKEQGAKPLTSKNALILLANENVWLRQALAAHRECSCNACYLCAYRTLDADAERMKAL
jgi:hypothetical protein